MFIISNTHFKNYIKSIELEFDVDKMYREVFKYNWLLIYFPRSVIIYSKFKRCLTFLIYILYPLFFVLFPLIINPIYVTLNALRWLPALFKFRKGAIPQNIYFSLSDIKFFNYIKHDEINYPSARIYFPFHSSRDTLNSSLVQINFFSLTNFCVYINAYIFSLITPLFLIFSKKRYLMLFTYSAFYWYLAYFTFSKYRINSIWFSNHYDRWTKLVDILSNVNQKILIQHGQLEYVKIETSMDYFPNLTEKLNNINVVYHLNKKSKEYFLKMISNKSVKFHELESRLNIISWDKKDQIVANILILGHQNECKFHQKLAENLTKRGVFNIAYKLHPQQSEELIGINYLLIKKTEDLPNADIIISYGSSLDIEIKQLLPKTIIVNYGFNDKFDINMAIDNIERNIYNKLRLEYNTY